MTRLWPEGVPIEVVQDADGAPLSFRWEGRRHGVCVLSNAWRVDVAWWSDRRWRAYYKLTTDTGLLVAVYRDLLTEAWYLQRLYD